MQIMDTVLIHRGMAIFAYIYLLYSEEELLKLF